MFRLIYNWLLGLPDEITVDVPNPPPPLPPIAAHHILSLAQLNEEPDNTPQLNIPRCLG